MCKVFNECCKNCLLSKDRIVSPKRAISIINSCAKNDTHFICHKASMEGEDIMCRGFYDAFGDKIGKIRIMERMGAIEFVPQKDSTKLPTYTETQKG